MEMAITTLSSKGQIVIPVELREGMEAGEKLIILRNDRQIIIKRVIDLEENMKEDLEFAKRTEEAYQQHERGEFITMNAEKFLKAMKKW